MPNGNCLSRVPQKVTNHSSNNLSSLGQEGEAQGQRPRERHQKVQRIREGDVVALPAGVTHWLYNDGDVPVVAVTVSDISNSANQLEPRRRV